MNMTKSQLINRALTSANDLMEKHKVLTEDLKQDVYVGIIDALSDLSENELNYTDYAMNNFIDEVINRVINDAVEESIRHDDKVYNTFKKMYEASEVPSTCNSITLVEIIDNKLDPIEKRIIELRYGINGVTPCKYSECRNDIHKNFGRVIPISIIKKMELTILKKLRSLLSNL